ncbi:hypothetical protein OROGR_011267 [Orobanche gracilis]
MCFDLVRDQLQPGSCITLFVMLSHLLYFYGVKKVYVVPEKAKKGLYNLINLSSIMRKFQVGDQIQVGGIQGEVEVITLTETTIIQDDGYSRIILDNSYFETNNLTLLSQAESHTIVGKFVCVLPDRKKKSIKDAILNMLKTHGSMYMDRAPPSCKFDILGDDMYSVTLKYNLKRMVDVVGVFRYKNTWPLCLEFLRSGQIDVKPLITHRSGLSQKEVEDAFETSARGGTAIKVMFNLYT